jgi:hypothetical protein
MVWITRDYTFVAYHTSSQTFRWNHLTQWCQLPSNIDEAFWWLYTFPPCPTTMVGWQTLEKNLFKNMMNLPQMMMKVVWVVGMHPLHGETTSNNVLIIWISCHFHDEFKTLTWISPLKSNHKRMIHLWWFKLNLQGCWTCCDLTKPPKHKPHNMNLGILHLYG